MIGGTSVGGGRDEVEGMVEFGEMMGLEGEGVLRGKGRGEEGVIEMDGRSEVGLEEGMVLR